MWLPNDVVAAVDRVARVHYIDRAACVRWNSVRRDGELRLLTGWCWTAKSGSHHRLGLKTKTVCYRDAWYELVHAQHAAAPGLPRRRHELRAVA